MKKLFTLLLMLVPLLGFGQNFLENKNPGFESVGDMSKWRNFNGNASIERTTTDKHSGEASCKVTIASGGDWHGMMLNGKLSLNAGSYVFSAWVKGTAGNNINFMARVYDADGTTKKVDVAKSYELTGDWQQVQHPFDIDVTGYMLSPIGDFYKLKL
ncbi:carbohydrate binding domain-containing protein [Carboxylicivirga marina]|uniref:Carbohydrate binding domain-containing protein n=1 Tax=Carboxylicivirga marina TaxID=2800988 RepID=A0ABS1HQK6_9BACT|nr:carbohydrate binding domain-containing protein [Carboxylicivirga marina]MBK3519866.1 carbohydrate binding domain-containing protein [Carboxylicivirga marina]